MKTLGQTLFEEILEEKALLGDLLILERDESGTPTRYESTAQAQTNFELGLASNLLGTVSQYLRPENCN